MISISQILSDILLQLKADQEEQLSKLNISNSCCQIFYDFRYGIPSNSTINKSLKRLLEKRSIQPKMTATAARHTDGYL